MSEVQRNLFSKRACGVFLAGALILLVIVLALRTSPPPTETFTIKETPNSPLRLGEPPRTPSRVRFQFSTLPPLQSDFYRTIIDNNLFGPLGWTLPRPIEPYRLIGTLVARDTNTPPKVILQSTAGNTTHIVTTGDKLDADTEVVSIEAKQVTLQTNGQQRSLSLNADLWIR